MSAKIHALIMSCFLFTMSTPAMSQQGCAGSLPDAAVFSSFETSKASEYGSAYREKVADRYNNIDLLPVDPTCKEKLDSAYACCMDIDACGGYTGSAQAAAFNASSEISSRSHVVNASLEAMNAASRGSSLCQMRRQDCSRTCGGDTSIWGNAEGQYICDSLVVSEHQGHLQAQDRLKHTCSTYGGLQRAAASTVTGLGVICSGQPPVCFLQGL